MIFLRAFSAGSTAFCNGLFKMGGSRSFGDAAKIFQDMVGRQGQSQSDVSPGRILGYHRTSSTSAVELVRSQQFIGRRGGVHVGTHPDQNGEFGPCVLAVIAEKPAEVALRVFTPENVKIETIDNVTFRPFRYDQELEGGMRSRQGYEDYETGDFE